jgi:hypothetical protein
MFLAGCFGTGYHIDSELAKKVWKTQMMINKDDSPLLNPIEPNIQLPRTKGKCKDVPPFNFPEPTPTSWFWETIAVAPNLIQSLLELLCSAAWAASAAPAAAEAPQHAEGAGAEANLEDIVAYNISFWRRAAKTLHILLDILLDFGIYNASKVHSSALHCQIVRSLSLSILILFFVRVCLISMGIKQANTYAVHWQYAWAV